MRSVPSAMPKSPSHGCHQPSSGGASAGSATQDAHQSLRRQKVQELLSYISDRSLKGLPVDIGRVVFTTSLNLLSRTIFSVDLVDLHSESSQEFKQVVLEIMKEAGGSNLSDFFPRLAPIDLQGRRRRLTALFEKLQDILDEQINRRLQSKEEQQASKDFLEVLLHRQVQQDNFKMDRQVMKSLFMVTTFKLILYLCQTFTSFNMKSFSCARTYWLPVPTLARARWNGRWRRC